MSQQGVFAVDRGIWSDTDFADGEFSEREAFIWLVGQAAWKPTRIRIGSASVDLARGQCAFSTRFLAEKWGWSEARVRRYLGRLISREIICAAADRKSTHITILKYDRFQRVSLPEAETPTQTRRSNDAPPTHQRRKEEDREYTQDIQDTSSLRSEEPAKATAKRRSGVDREWQIGAPQIADAAKHGMTETQARTEWSGFIDHHLKLGSKFADWPAAWRTWCRNFQKFAERDRERARASPQRRQSNADAWAADFYHADDRIQERRYDDRPHQGRGQWPASSGQPSDDGPDRRGLRGAGTDWRPHERFRLVGSA